MGELAFHGVLENSLKRDVRSHGRIGVGHVKVERRGVNAGISCMTPQPRRGGAKIVSAYR